MKVKFTMTDEEFQEIKAIAQRPSTPVMKFGDYTSGFDKQEDANLFWQKLADKYGFVWDTVESGGSDPKVFIASSKDH